MQDKEQKIVIFNRICMICFVCMTICYNISWDLFVITIFMVSAFCIGGFFFKKNNNSLDFLFQFGIGLGVISVILYFYTGIRFYFYDCLNCYNTNYYEQKGYI